MAYTPTSWVDGVTKLGPTNLNKLETGAQAAAATADTASAAATAAQTSATAAQTTANSALAKESRAELLATGQGLISQNYDRSIAGGGASSTDGTVFFMALGLRAADVVTKLSIAISSAGGGITTSKVGLYKKDGTRLALSADQGTAWQSSGVKTISMITPYTVPADDLYYGAIIVKFSVASPTFLMAMQASTAGSVGEAVGSGARAYGIQAGQTDLPSPATIAVGSKAYWIGAS
jgi:hypothetical protein